MNNLDYDLKFKNILDFFPTRFFSYLNRIENSIGNIDKIDLPKKIQRRANLISLYQGIFYGEILIAINILKS